MLIKKNGRKEILKRMLDLDLKYKDLNEVMGYRTGRGFNDFLYNIQRGKGYISQNKLERLEEQLEMSLMDYYG